MSVRVMQGETGAEHGEALSACRADTAVVMCVYAKDDPRHFREALTSILQQSHRDLTVFLMVDGIVGAALDTVIRSCDDPRLRVRRSVVNRGLAVSLNELIDEVLSGACEFVARMDADDFSEPERLAKQTLFLRANVHVDVLGTSCSEVDNEGKFLCVKRLPTTDLELKQRMLARCPFIHPTVIFRRRVFESGVRYQTNNHLTEDMFLWVDLATDGFVFANLRESLLRYRVGPEFYGRRKRIQEGRVRVSREEVYRESTQN